MELRAVYLEVGKPDRQIGMISLLDLYIEKINTDHGMKLFTPSKCEFKLITEQGETAGVFIRTLFI